MTPKVFSKPASAACAVSGGANIDGLQVGHAAAVCGNHGVGENDDFSPPKLARTIASELGISHASPAPPRSPR